VLEDVGRSVGGHYNEALLLGNDNGPMSQQAHLEETYDLSNIGGGEEQFLENSIASPILDTKMAPGLSEGHTASRGCMEEVQGVGGRPKQNQHIRFRYDESEASDFSDSIHDYEGEEQRILKIRQRSRNKKKSGSFSKKRLNQTPSIPMEGSPNVVKTAKRKYHVDSMHRRMVSQPIFKDDGWSDSSAGKRILSLDDRAFQGAGSGGFMGEEVESVPESQGRKLKILAAKRVLRTQKQLGVSYPAKEGGIIDKLVHQEELAVKVKAQREEGRVYQ